MYEIFIVGLIYAAVMLAIWAGIDIGNRYIDRMLRP